MIIKNWKIKENVSTNKSITLDFLIVIVISNNVVFTHSQWRHQFSFLKLNVTENVTMYATSYRDFEHLKKVKKKSLFYLFIYYKLNMFVGNIHSIYGWHSSYIALLLWKKYLSWIVRERIHVVAIEKCTTKIWVHIS